MGNSENTPKIPAYSVKYSEDSPRKAFTNPLHPKRQPQAQIPQLPNPESEKSSDRLSR